MQQQPARSGAAGSCGWQAGVAVAGDLCVSTAVGDLGQNQAAQHAAAAAAAESAPAVEVAMHGSVRNSLPLGCTGADRCIAHARSSCLQVVSSDCRATVGQVSGGGRTEKPMLKAGRAYHKYRVKRNSWPKVRLRRQWRRWRELRSAGRLGGSCCCICGRSCCGGAGGGGHRASASGSSMFKCRLGVQLHVVLTSSPAPPSSPPCLPATGAWCGHEPRGAPPRRW